MALFKGEIKNEFGPETGVNISVMGLGANKMILAPRGPAGEFSKTEGGSTLKFILRPSSGGTEGGSDGTPIVQVEVKEGEAAVDKTGNHWEVEIRNASASSECFFSVTIDMKWEWA